MSMLWEIVGSTAATLTMFGFVPQIVKVYKTRSAEDVSLPALLQFSLGLFLWFLYGVHLENLIIIVSNLISLCTIIVLIALCLRYRAGRGRMVP